MAPLLFGKGKWERETWFYFTENELLPGAVRYHQFKFEFNLRGDGGQPTGGGSVDTNLGWKGPEKYTAIVPQVYDLWQDPQERYDIFMTNFIETTWIAPVMGDQLKKLAKTYVDYPPRPLQSEGYTGPITLTDYQKFEFLREQLKKGGINLPMPTGN
jgi:arylsulfatase